MAINSHLKTIRNIAIILFVLSIPNFLFAQEVTATTAKSQAKYSVSTGVGDDAFTLKILKHDSNVSAPKAEEEQLSELQKQARIYRSQGQQAQSMGDLDTAWKWYTKCVELDPTYAVVYNDLGIISEARGFNDQAEAYYLKAIRIDPNYLSSYTNLALLYEGRRELNKAALCWAKRVELGSSDDPWTIKAKQRLEDIQLVSSISPIEDSREQEVVSLLNEVATKKSIIKKSNQELSKEHFRKAKLCLDKEDYPAALKEAVDARQLDPTNQEIDEFIEKVQTRALTR
jgi:tetratricopeptide (TPR) repeat protein